MNKLVGYVLSISVFIGLLSGCKDPKDLQDWVDKMSTLKNTVEAQSDVTPYSEDQFNAFKSYFEELGLLAISLKDEEGVRWQFNETLKKSDLGTLCQQILITKDRWQLIANRCMRNRFFLCSDEVIAYQTFVKALRDSMDEGQKARFDAAYSCKSTIE